MTRCCWTVLIAVVITMLAIALEAPGLSAVDVVNPRLHVISENNHGWLGVSVQDISEAIAEASDLDTDKGVLINEVMEESPAQEAGLETGDVILKFNGEDIEDTRQFVEMIRESSPSDEARLSVIRDGREREIEVQIGERPENPQEGFFGQGAPPALEHREILPFSIDLPELAGNYMGVRIEEMNPQLAEALELKNAEGVLVIEAEEDGPAYEAGIRGGDVITKIDDEKISDADELRSVIGKKEKGDQVKVSVIRDEKRKSFDVTIEESPFLSSCRGKIVIPDAVDELTDGMERIKEFRFEIQDGLKDEMASLKEELDKLKDQLDDLKKEMK